jgi:hypothetical protein
VKKPKKKNKQLLILVHAEKIDVLNSSKTKLCNWNQIESHRMDWDRF